MIWILCSYEKSGYLDYSFHRSKDDALNHAPWDNENWCVVRYNLNSGKYSTVYAEGQVFPVNILRSSHNESRPLTIYSVSVDKLSKPELHYSIHYDTPTVPIYDNSM